MGAEVILYENITMYSALQLDINNGLRDVSDKDVAIILQETDSW